MRDDGFTALHIASARGDLGNVKALVAAGAPVGAINSYGWSPMHWAARNGHAAIVQVLMDADVELGLRTSDGRTAVQLTLDSGVMKLLGPYVPTRPPRSTSETSSTEDKPPASSEAASALEPASAEKPALTGEALAAAAEELRAAALRGDAATVTAVLARGVNLAVDSCARSPDGFTPLHIAACLGYADVVAALIAAGASAEVVNAYGWTALHWAARNGHPGVVQAIVSTGGGAAKMETPDGRTPMQLTFDSEVIRILADVVPPKGFNH